MLFYYKTQAFQSGPETFQRIEMHSILSSYLWLPVFTLRQLLKRKKKKNQKTVVIKGMLEGHHELISSIDPTLPIA